MRRGGEGTRKTGHLDAGEVLEEQGAIDLHAYISSLGYEGLWP